MTVGEKIKLLRKRARMTQAKLAEILNVTTRSVIYYERNQRNPADDILEKLSELFSVPIDVVCPLIVVSKVDVKLVTKY